jgi:hypothetical protein
MIATHHACLGTFLKVDMEGRRYVHEREPPYRTSDDFLGFHALFCIASVGLQMSACIPGLLRCFFIFMFATCVAVSVNDVRSFQDGPGL